MIKFQSIAGKYAALLLFLSSLCLHSGIALGQSGEFVARSENTNLVLLTSQMIQRPSRFNLKLPVPSHIEHPVLQLYDLLGNLRLQKQLETGQTVSLVDFINPEQRLPAGYYLYRFESTDTSRPLVREDTLWFNDISLTNLPGPTHSGMSAMADFTGDNSPDIVVTRFGAFHQPLLFVNEGSGRFIDETASRFPLLDLAVNDVLPVDADRDGDLDIIITGEEFSDTTNYIWLFENDGAGHFSDVSASHLPSLPFPLFNADCSDINNDQWPDLVFTGFPLFSKSTPLLTLLNDTTGGFYDASATLLPATSYNAYDTRVEDVNGDSLADIVLACLGDLVLSIPMAL